MTASTLDRAFRKISLRIYPLLCLGFIVAYLERVNVAFAKLQMMKDLHLSEAAYGLGAGAARRCS